ncbi:hypothetical protein BDD12DRAFT_894898 [Trichophaea hybrida]|nr:hypothetical protein BDD12DRAFT_894898 [Trichophaea hybrida]
MPSIHEEMLLARDNSALRHNQPIANNNITTHGSDLDWAICALHAFLLLSVIVWTYMTNPRRRVFHYFAISILSVATIYYFVIASNLGGAAVPVEFRGGNILNRTRQVFYARWVGYFINFSLIWFALLLMSGVGWASILFTLGLNMLWASMFLIGMFVRSSYKWGFFVIAVILWGLIVWQTMGIARSHAYTVESNTHRTFTILALWELFLMMLYPISWALSEGGNRITNDAEQIFYSVLDVLSQGVFSILLLSLSRSLDLDILGLAFTENGRIKNRVSEQFTGTNHSATIADTTTGYAHGAAEAHADPARP